MLVRTIVPRYRSRRSLETRRPNRLFGEFFNEFGGYNSFANTFNPRIDLSENDQEIKVVAELPGLEKNEIELSLEQNVLSISGEKKAEKENKGDNYYHAERAYGSFCRRVALSSDVEVDQVEASYKNGVLTITLPKSVEAQAKRIEVKAS